jgi:hypothetical protein
MSLNVRHQSSNDAGQYSRRTEMSVCNFLKEDWQMHPQIILLRESSYTCLSQQHSQLTDLVTAGLHPQILHHFA